MICRIGILDDEPLVRDAIRSKLAFTSISYEVAFESDDGHAVLAALRDPEIPLDLMIVDIVMPRMDGLDFIQEAQQLRPDVRYIIASGHDDFAYARTAIRLGVHDYLMKPITTDELETAVRTAYDRLSVARDVREAELRNEIGFWLLHRGDAPLDEPALAYLADGLRTRPHLYVALAGNFHSRSSAAHDAGTQDGGVRFPLYEVDLENTSVYLHASVNYASHIEGFLGGSTTTIVHVDGVSDPEQVPEIVTRAVRRIRESLVLDDHLVLHVTADELLDHSSWAEFEREHHALLDRIRREHRFDRGLEVLRGILGRTLPQRVKEHAVQLFMTATVRLDVPLEWLQSYDRADEFMTGCLEMIRVVQSEPTPISGREILRRVVHDLEAQFASRKTLQDYADEYGIHPNHLARLFKQETGRTFLESLTGARMKAARRLLCETDRTVSEVAAEAGYDDSRYFSQVFRRHAGVTPSQYRSEQC